MAGYEESCILSKSNSYYSIINDIKNPLFLFFVCDFLNYNSDDTISYKQQEGIGFKKRVSYNNKIISFFENVIILNNTNYKLIDIVTTHTFNHYNGYLINIESSIFELNLLRIITKIVKIVL